LNITAIVPFEVGIPLPGDPASCPKRKKFSRKDQLGPMLQFCG